MLEVINYESFKSLKEKYRTERFLKMEKYAQMRTFHNYRWIQDYMYYFMYNISKVIKLLFQMNYQDLPLTGINPIHPITGSSVLRKNSRKVLLCRNIR